MVLKPLSEIGAAAIWEDFSRTSQMKLYKTKEKIAFTSQIWILLSAMDLENPVIYFNLWISTFENGIEKY